MRIAIILWMALSGAAFITLVAAQREGCGGEFNAGSGVIRHPLNGTHYQNLEHCTWIIRAEHHIKLTFVTFDTIYNDILTIRDGESIESTELDKFSGVRFIGGDVPRSVQTSTNAAHLLFTSSWDDTSTGFELHWEPLVETFYQVLPHNDHEVRLNFSASPQHTALELSYGSNFEKMGNLSHIHSDNGKFSPSLIDLENGNYQFVLKITGVTEEDLATKFKLHIVGVTYYRFTLSAFPHPPWSLEISDIMPTSVRITWTYKYNVKPGDYYVIKYKPRNSDQSYSYIADIHTNFYTVRGLMPFTKYEFYVLALKNDSLGPPSEPAFVTTNWKDCGGEYKANFGVIRHPFNGGHYDDNEKCTWIIRAEDRLTISFVTFDTRSGADFLAIRDGDSLDTNVLGRFNGSDVPRSLSTSTNAAHLVFTSDYILTTTGFELHWGPLDVVFNFSDIIVSLNETIQLECGIKTEYRFCVWKKDIIYQVEAVRKGGYNGKGRPENTENNQCGIAVDQATIKDNGIWTCIIYTQERTFVGRKNIVVIVKPTQAEVSPQGVFTNVGIMQAIKCSIKAANPAVKISWTLNGRNISSNAQTEERPNKPDGLYMSSSTLQYIFYPEDNGQKLECVIEHIKLAEPQITTIPIAVFFAPISKNDQNYYQIPMHSNHEIRINFYANPSPIAIKWTYGQNLQVKHNIIQIPSDNGKFSTSLINNENGNYQAILRIANMIEEDFETKFILYVTNNRGKANYRTVVYTGEKPDECQDGFHRPYGGRKCFKIYRDKKRTFFEAKEKCKEEGLTIATTTDAVAVDLRKILLEEYGNGAVWLNARGNGTMFLWQTNNKVLPNDSPFWQTTMPSSPTWTTTEHCLMLMIYHLMWSSEPGSPYGTYPCAIPRLTLCEDTCSSSIQNSSNEPTPTLEPDMCSSSIQNSSNEPSPTLEPGVFFSAGCFMSNGPVHCFKIFKDMKRSWYKAQKKCEEEGQLVAKPTDIVAIPLRKYLVDRHGGVPVWLDARGDGSTFKWQQTKEVLSGSNPLWISGYPTSIMSTSWPYPGWRVTNKHCLTMAANFVDWRHRPEQTYVSDYCVTPKYTLCQGCPFGFFKVKGSNQCFKFFNDVRRSWSIAKRKCAREGLHLAEPIDAVAVALRTYLVNRYDDGGAWLSGRGKDGGFVWQRSMMELRPDSQLWRPEAAPRSNNADSCLVMLLWTDDFRSHPGQPYGSEPCTWTRNTLCEIGRE